MRRQSSSSALKPFICTLRLTSAVLIWVHQNPLLKARRNAHLNALGAEYFAPLHINWVEIKQAPLRSAERLRRMPLLPAIRYQKIRDMPSWKMTIFLISTRKLGKFPTCAHLGECRSLPPCATGSPPFGSSTSRFTRLRRGFRLNLGLSLRCSDPNFHFVQLFGHRDPLSDGKAF